MYNRCQLMSTSGNTTLFSFKDTIPPLTQISISPNGQFIAAYSETKDLLVYSIDFSEQLAKLDAFNVEPDSISWYTFHCTLIQGVVLMLSFYALMIPSYFSGRLATGSSMNTCREFIPSLKSMDVPSYLVINANLLKSFQVIYFMVFILLFRMLQ
jgi:hypothetical protein